MNTKIKKAKEQLINLMCEETKNIIKNSKADYKICKIGWVDYLHGKNLIKHIFTHAYIAVGGAVVLVESDYSEASVNLKMNQVSDINKLEQILKGLKFYDQQLNK